MESAGRTRPVRSAPPRPGYGLLRAPVRSEPTPSPAAGARDPGDPAPPSPPLDGVPLGGLRRRGWYLYSGWSALCFCRSRSASCTNGFFPSSFNSLHTHHYTVNSTAIYGDQHLGLSSHSTAPTPPRTPTPTSSRGCRRGCRCRCCGMPASGNRPRRHFRWQINS